MTTSHFDALIFKQFASANLSTQAVCLSRVSRLEVRVRKSSACANAQRNMVLGDFALDHGVVGPQLVETKLVTVTEPWRTPRCSVNDSDSCPSILTLTLHSGPEYYERSNLHVWPTIPHSCAFFSRTGYCTVLKTFCRS